MKGSITVFFSLVFVTIVSVLGATIESARWACARLYLRQAADDGIRSVFADYYKPLFEEYGVLFLDETYGQGISMIDERFEKYLTYNINPNYGNFFRRSFLYKSDISDIEVQKKILAIDGKGEVFRQSAYEYMKYRIPANLAESFLEQLDFINQAEVIRDFFSQIQGIQEDLSKIDEVILRINSCVEEIRQLQQTIEGLADKVNELLSIEKPDKEIKKLLEDKKEELFAAKQNTAELVLKILEDSDIYEEVTKRVNVFLRGLADEWMVKHNVSQSIRDIVLEEIDSLMMHSGGKGDLYGIERSKSILENMQEQLEVWVRDHTSGRFDILDGLEITINLPEPLPDELAKGFNVEELWSEFCSGGVYSLICPDYVNLSEAEIKPFNNRAYAWERAETYTSDKSIVGEAVTDIVFQEYIKQMFANYANQEENTAVKYEMEYIISGNRVDKDNINAIIGKLLAVREGLNLVYIMCDSQKKSEAHALALACLGFTGIYVGVKALEYLILMVWAMGESMLDVRILMSGGSVPVVKRAGDWKLDFDGILNIGEILTSLAAPGKKNGVGDWCYEDYLKIFLYIQNRDDQVLRVLDLIEENLQKNYSTAFCITNCVQKLNMKATFRIKPLFSSNQIFDRESEINFGYAY